MVTRNAWNSRNPAEEVRGGTNQSSYTQGDMLYASAANTLAKIAIGSNGQVLTSNGTIPTWAAASSSGSLVLLNTTTASSSSSVSWGNTIITSTYNVYSIRYWNCVTTDYIALRVSTDNGSTWKSASGDYGTTYAGTNGSYINSATSGSSTQQIKFGGNDPAITGTTPTAGEVSIYTPTSASNRTLITYSTLIAANNGDVSQQLVGHVRGGGVRWVAEADNAIEIIPLSGTISGTFSIYGVAS